MKKCSKCGHCEEPSPSKMSWDNSKVEPEAEEQEDDEGSIKMGLLDELLAQLDEGLAGKVSSGKPKALSIQVIAAGKTPDTHRPKDEEEEDEDDLFAQ
jgi:hypothetical protein